MTILQNAAINFQGKDVAKYTMAVAVMMTGLAASKIRKVEEFGLCRPARTGSKQRLFSDNDIQRLYEIALLEKDGVNLQGIKIILDMQKPTRAVLSSVQFAAAGTDGPVTGEGLTLGKPKIRQHRSGQST